MIFCSCGIFILTIISLKTTATPVTNSYFYADKLITSLI